MIFNIIGKKMNKKKITLWLILFTALFVSANYSFAQTNFWNPTSGPVGTNVWSLAISSAGDLWAGTDGGVFKSTNNGDIWEAKNSGLTSDIIGVGGQTGGTPLLVRAIAIKNSNGYLFAGTLGGLFRSVDNGANWVRVLPDLNIRAVLINSSGTIFAGVEGMSSEAGIYVSNDNGATWTQKNEGLWNLFVRSLAITSGGTILAGTSGSGVFRSTDNGENWLIASNSINVSVEAITVTNTGVIYAATNQSPNIGVLKSTDNGATWAQVNTGLTDLQVNAIIFNPTTSHVFCGTYNQGVFRTTNGGSNWYRFNTGLPPIVNGNNAVRTFTLNSTGVMFAGTLGSGVYRSQIFLNPVLYTDKDTLVFTAAWGAALPASQQFLVENIGTGTLNWTAAKTASWFDISPASGTNSGLVTVSINSTTSQSPGTYYQNITLTAPGAGTSSPKNVVVKYIITGPGISVVSALNFGNVMVGSYKDSSITITNTGNATLTIPNAASFKIIGIDQTMFALTGSITYPINIAAGANRTFGIRFTPASIGTKTATLSINHNVPVVALSEVALTGNGVNPIISINPLSINFGNINVGSSRDSIVTISSVGNAKLNINSITISGADASSFTFTAPTLPYEIASGSNYLLPVRFTPVSVGAKSAIMIITHNAEGSPDTVSLNGVGVKPEILISPDTLNYGDVFTGSFKDLKFSISNSGSAPLIISSITKSGTDIAQFYRYSFPDSSLLPIVVNPGSMVSVNVRFAPNSDGQKSSFWILNHNAQGGQTTLYLRGRGVTSSVSIQPSPSLDFGSVQLGDRKDSSILVSNTGSTPVTISNIFLSGTDQSSFTSSSGVIILQPGEKLKVDVRFLPVSLGSKSAIINIVTSASAQPYTVTLTGNGVGIPVIVVDPTDLDFGSININSISTKTVKVRNTGNAPLVISSIQFLGTDAASFTLASPDVTFTVNPNESYDLQISFIPTTIGNKSARVVLNHNSAGSNSTINLSGIGVNAAITIQPNSLDFGDILVSSSSSKSIKISNNGSATLTINSLSIAGTNQTMFSLVSAPATPLSVAPGSSVDLNISFSPSSVGSKTAELIISSNASSVDSRIPLSGRGVAPGFSITPSPTLDFGSINVSASKNGNITITNTGTAPLLVSNLQISGADVAMFRRISSPDSSTFSSITLAASQSFTFTFSFTPTSAGSKSAKVTFTHALGSSDINLVGVGLAAGISINPSPLNFGNVVVNNSKDLTLSISNTGNASLTITKFEISGVDASMFQRFSTPDSQSIQITLNPLQTYTVTLRFIPVSSGNKTATLKIRNSVSDVDVALSGVGLAGGIALDPVNLNFGNLRVGRTKIDSIKVTNIGLAPLNISKIDITNKTFFTLPDNPGARSLSAGASFYIRVQFSPTSVGLKTSVLEITHDATGGLTSAQLSGTGIYPDITLSPSSQIDFGDVNIGSSKDLTLQVTNSGTDTLTVSSISIGGTNSALFTLPNGESSFKLAPAGNRVITIRFSPLTVGAKTGSITIVSDALSSPSIISLKGNGIVSNVRVGILKNYGGKPGDLVTIPVQALDDLTGKNAKSFTLVLKYKKTILYPKDIGITGTLSDGLTLSTTDSKPGELHIQVTNSSTKLLTGTGNLVNITFQALLGDTCGTHLILESFVFNTDGPTAVRENGYFNLIGRCGGEKGYVTSDPNSFLMQNSPNPVKAGNSSNIQFKLGIAGYTHLAIYDLLGREVMKLVDGNRGQGFHEVSFDTKDLPTGVYFYRLRTADFDSLRKMLIIR